MGGSHWASPLGPPLSRALNAINSAGSSDRAPGGDDCGFDGLGHFSDLNAMMGVAMQLSLRMMMNYSVQSTACDGFWYSRTRIFRNTNKPCPRSRVMHIFLHSQRLRGSLLRLCHSFLSSLFYSSHFFPPARLLIPRIAPGACHESLCLAPVSYVAMRRIEFNIYST